MTQELDTTTAKRIIRSLKVGTTPYDCTEYTNVGNEQWYNAASELFEDIHNDNDSLVRLINGYYGDGKSHFLGMLRSIALAKNWTVAYVTAEKTPLNKFDIVYSEIIKNFTLPPGVKMVPWSDYANTKGGGALLIALFSKIYFESYRPGGIEGVKKQGVLESLRVRSNEIAALPGINETIGNAIRGFTESVIRSDSTTMHQIASWLEGENIKIPEWKISRRIDQKFSRDAMRSISLMATRAGCSGMLVLLDEAERIMEQSRPVRNKSYGVLRDLLDNADQQGGMRSSIMYVASTPDMFTSEKGFAEYEALRSRLAAAERFILPDFIDWRGVIIDLTKTPLPHDVMVQLGKRIRDVHAIAQNWNPKKKLTDELILEIVDRIYKGPFFQVSKPRMIASATTILLEIAEQNRHQEIAQIISQTLENVNRDLAEPLKGESWD